MKTPTERVEELESPFLGELLFASEVDGDLLTRPLLRESAFGAAPGIELQAAPGISGVDDRTEVQNTIIPPYRWVCSIAYEAGGQTLQGGTGLLISNRHVLTAGHVVRDKASAPAAHSVYVYPGRHFGGEPFGRIQVARARVSTRFDFGLITLERPVDPGVQWWGHPSTRTAWWNEDLIPCESL
jgi:V8-like Glu-specific endopeptidase